MKKKLIKADYYRACYVRGDRCFAHKEVIICEHGCKKMKDHPCSDLEPIELPSIADAVYFRMEQYGHTQREACEKMGIAFSHLNEAMKGKRRFSITQVKALYKYGIPAHVLLQ